jgi:hypothetical protein
MVSVTYFSLATQNFTFYTNKNDAQFENYKKSSMPIPFIRLS